MTERSTGQRSGDNRSADDHHNFPLPCISSKLIRQMHALTQYCLLHVLSLSARSWTFFFATHSATCLYYLAIVSTKSTPTIFLPYGNTKKCCRLRDRKEITAFDFISSLVYASAFQYQSYHDSKQTVIESPEAASTSGKRQNSIFSLVPENVWTLCACLLIALSLKLKTHSFTKECD